MSRGGKGREQRQKTRERDLELKGWTGGKKSQPAHREGAGKSPRPHSS